MIQNIQRSFFEQKTLAVAQQLLGCFLIHKSNQQELVGRIIETEAYIGPKDKANHASHGRTNRTEVMFGPAGYSYIYLIYGMYHCFNVVTEKEGYPAAVLIRGLEIINKQKVEKVIGPGKVCREMKIDKKYHNIDLVNNKKLFIVKQLKNLLYKRSVINF